MGVQPEQFLQADRDGRPLLGLVVDREHACRSAPRNASALRAPAARANPTATAPSAPPTDRRPKSPSATSCRSSAGTSHVSRCGCQRVVGQIGPDFVALGLAQEHHAVAPLLQRFRPWQADRGPAAISPSARIRAVSADGASASGASDSVIACSVFLRRARSAIAPRSNEISSAVSIWSAKRCFDLGLRDRRRQQDAAVARRCRSVRRPRYRARAPARRSDRPPRRGRWRARNCRCRDCARRDRERRRRA